MEEGYAKECGITVKSIEKEKESDPKGTCEGIKCIVSDD